MITRVEPRVIGTVAKAAGVPMGLEMAAIARPSAPRKLTGLTVRASA